MTAEVGVVLAAGFGSRLRAAAAEGLKPLTEVAGKPLMLRTLDTLQRAGCRQAVVVVGHGGRQVAAAVRSAYDGPLELTLVENPRYELANGLSVLAARPVVGTRTFLLTMADHVFDAAMARIARSCEPPPGGACLLVDRKLNTIFDMEDATKVRTDGDRVAAIGKGLSEFDAVDTGLFVATTGLFDALEDVFEARGDASLSEGVAVLCRAGKMAAVDVEDAFWQDVDTPEMLAHAEAVLSGAAGQRSAPAGTHPDPPGRAAD